MQNVKDHWREGEAVRQERLRREQEERMKFRRGRYDTYGYMVDPITGAGPVPLPNYDQLDDEAKERVKDVRASLYWIYRPRNLRECQV